MIEKCVRGKRKNFLVENPFPNKADKRINLRVLFCLCQLQGLFSSNSSLTVYFSLNVNWNF